MDTASGRSSSTDAAAIERHYVSGRPELMPFVRRYTHVSVTATAKITRIVPARADLLLQVIVTGAQSLRNLLTGEARLAPRATLFGPCTRPIIETSFSGALELLLIQFQPTALDAHPSIEVRAVLDNYADAETALEIDAGQLVADFGQADCGARKIEAADRFAIALFRLAIPPDVIGCAARQLRDNPGGLSLQTLARVSGLSRRQFQRRFARQVGLAPKAYARLCRISAVLDARETNPDQTLADVAAEFGYADQAHLSREFREMTQQTPSRFERHH